MTKKASTANRIRYYVSPRYTPGSPAMVSEEIALRVITEEQKSYEHAVAGVLGAEAQAKAFSIGMVGIVEKRQEQRTSWRVTDLCTGDCFVRPFPK